MVPVRQLKEVKTLREEARAREKRAAETRVDRAHAELQERIQERLNRDQERTRRESSLFADVCSRTVRLTDIDLMRHELDQLKMAVHQAQADEVAAESALDQAQVSLSESRQALTRARHATSKTDALYQGLVQEHAALQRRQDDAAFDEVCELITAHQKDGAGHDPGPSP